MAQHTYLFTHRPVFLRGSFFWKGLGYQYAEPAPPEILDKAVITGDDPWIALAASFEAAKTGQIASLAHLQKWVLDDRVAPTLVAACLDLMADVGDRRDLEFLAGLMLDGSDAIRISSCQVAQWCGALWLIPFMLEARQSVRRAADKRTIESNLSNLLEDIEGEPQLFDGNYDDDEYKSLIDRRHTELTSQAGSDKAIVFGGELMDMGRQLQRMKKALLRRTLNQWIDWSAFLLWRRKFEAFTGVDCSSFYSSKGAFLPENALPIVDRYIESNNVDGFEIGRRYFFGRMLLPT